MSARTELGRIQKATFGFGGYDDAMVGVSFTLGGESWGVGDFRGTWATRSERAEWTVEDQLGHFAQAVIFLRDVLAAAKKRDVAQLAGTPIEATFEGNRLSSWRVLTEVL